MTNKKQLSRITVDLPEDLQKRLKAFAALTDKSMREVVIESIETNLQKSEKQTAHNWFSRKL